VPSLTKRFVPVRVLELFNDEVEVIPSVVGKETRIEGESNLCNV